MNPSVSRSAVNEANMVSHKSVVTAKPVLVKLKRTTLLLDRLPCTVFRGRLA